MSMWQENIRITLNNAGWNLPSYEGSSRLTEVRNLIATRKEEVQGATKAAWVWGGLGTAALGIGYCIFPPLGFVAGGICGVVGFICNDQSQSVQKAVSTYKGPYISSSIDLFYLEEFKKALEEQRKVIRTIPQTEAPKEIKKITSLWEAASPFFDAYAPLQDKDDRDALMNCRKTLLQNCKNLQTSFDQKKITKQKFIKDSTSAIEKCLNAILDPKIGFITRMLEKQQETVKWARFHVTYTESSFPPNF